MTAQAAPRGSGAGQRRESRRVTWARTDVPRGSGGSRPPRALRQPRPPRALRQPRAPRGSRAPRKRKRRRCGTPHFPTSTNHNDPPEHYRDHDIANYRRLQEGLIRLHTGIRTFTNYRCGIAARLQRQEKGDSAASRLTKLCSLKTQINRLDKCNDHFANDDLIEEKNQEILSRLEAIRQSGSLSSYRRTDKNVKKHEEKVIEICSELNNIYQIIVALQELLQ